MDEERVELNEGKLVEIKELLSNSDVSVDKQDMKSLARYFVQLKSIEDSISAIYSDIEKILIQNKVNAQFPDMMRKVAYTEPRDISAIDKNLLAEHLFASGRTKDFVDSSSITETKLKMLRDGQELIEKFKKVVGSTKPGVQVRDMTKEEVKTSEKKKSKIKIELKRRH